MLHYIVTDSVHYIGAETRQTCPGFFLKSLLEFPENLLD